MAITNRPTVIVIGASADRRKFGNKSVRAHLKQGYTVYPVNPKGGEIEGVAAFRTLADLPRVPINRISRYVPPAVGITLLKEIAARQPTEVWFNPGSESPELIERAECEAATLITRDPHFPKYNVP